MTDPRECMGMDNVNFMYKLGKFVSAHTWTAWRLFWESLEDFLTDPPAPQFILPFQNWFPHKFSLHIVKATPQPKPNPAEVHHILYL